jgi:uncharacterized protein YbjT (DUF2867 family)
MAWQSGDRVVVTGASGFSGRFVTERLLAAGARVVNLTAHPDRPHPFGDRIETAELSFDRPGELERALAGAAVLFNTYWVRFARGSRTHDRAVENSRVLFQAAKRAGVRRIVHTSIANPSLESRLTYYRGKAEVEMHLAATGVPHTILRPTVLFGGEDILINNIAWMLRRFPAFLVPGDGAYRVQPVFVEDFADLAIDGSQRGGIQVIDAVGPETYTFDDLLRRIARCLDRRVRLLHTPPGIVHVATSILGVRLGDVVLTWQEIQGLMAGLLVSKDPPPCRTRLSEWLEKNAGQVGQRYASEIARHYRK